MKAEITAPQGFRIAPEGHTVVTLAAGMTVEGPIAEAAVLAGAARVLDEIAATLEHKGEPQKRQGRKKRFGE